MIRHVRILFGLIVVAAIILPGGSTSSALATEPSAEGLAEGTEHLELVGQIGGRAYAVAAEGNYVYVGIGWRMVILDVTDPGNPVVVGRTDLLADAVMGIEIVGQYAYLANGDGGLRIINIASHVVPFEIGFYDTPGPATDVVVVGPYAYVAIGGRGFRIVNVSNPVAPIEVGFYDKVGAWGMTVVGDYAYIASGGIGLHIVNVSDPITPTEVSNQNTPGSAKDVAVAGDYAYVADSRGGLRIIDIADPASPREVGVYATGSSAKGVVIAGNYAYLAADRKFYVVNVANPAVPSKVALYEASRYDYLAVSGNHIYVTGHGHAYTGWLIGLQIFDHSDPTMVLRIGSYTPPGDVWGVAVSGNYAYLADQYAGLHIIDASDPVNPVRVGTYNTPGEIRQVYVAGDYAYVADGYGGLRIINIADPSAPIEVGACDTPSYAKKLTVVGDYAYVSDSYGNNLRIINILDPHSPFEVSVYGMEYPNGLEVVGDYAYVASTYGTTGLQIINVSNPEAPVGAGFYDTPGYPLDVAVAGDYAYVADEHSGGLRIINISDPFAPTEVGSYYTPGYARAVEVVDGYAYVADGWTGVRVIDVSTPSVPVEIDSPDTLWYANDVAIAGDYVYVADEQGGLVILGRRVGWSTYRAEGAPTIDGDLQEWGNIPVAALSINTANNSVGFPSPEDLSGWLRVAWNPSRLYFGIHVNDDHLNATSENPWENDAIELGIDTNFNQVRDAPDHQFIVDIAGRVVDYGNPLSGITVVTQAVADGWSMEIAIPAVTLGPGVLAAERLIGFNWALDDNDGSGHESWLVWQGTQTRNASPDWGRLWLRPQSRSFLPTSTSTPTPTITPTPTPTPTTRATITSTPMPSPTATETTEPHAHRHYLPLLSGG